MSYYNAPSQYRRAEISADGRAVTICTDDCERFAINASADPGDLWDGVVLFKAYRSNTLIDDSFLKANSTLAQDVLQARATTCTKTHTPQSLATCALQSMAVRSGLRMARIVYDEGNKCESTWSFAEPQKLLKKHCSRVEPK